jgi:enamine deaminase RidA (YjgF/YER057c/UK114 family)
MTGAGRAIRETGAIGIAGSHSGSRTPTSMRMSCHLPHQIPLFLAAMAVAGAATPEQKLAELNVVLPTPSAPVANYVPAVRVGSLVFLAGHIPRTTAGQPVTGKVGRDVTVAEAAAAARNAATYLLASLKREIGDLSKVRRIVKVVGLVNCTDEFQQQSVVMNGCSDLLVSVFGERGRHARAALGTNALPVGAVVEIDMIVEVE